MLYHPLRSLIPTSRSIRTTSSPVPFGIFHQSLTAAEWFGKEESTIRDAHAYAYQQYGTTYNWSQYVHLGYFAYTHCSDFDKIWAKIQNDPLMVHRAIWYNFTYHVERDIPMSEPLTTWAMNISQPFLEYHDLKYLDVDTMKHPTGVACKVKNDQTKTPNEQ
jgi:hypothetical protein